MRSVATFGVGLLLAAWILGLMMEPPSIQSAAVMGHQWPVTAAMLAKPPAWLFPAQILFTAAGLGLLAAAWLVTMAVGAVGLLVDFCGTFLRLILAILRPHHAVGRPDRT